MTDTHNDAAATHTDPFWEPVGDPAIDQLIADLNQAQQRLKQHLYDLDGDLVDNLGDAEYVALLLKHRMRLVDAYAAMAFHIGHYCPEAVLSSNSAHVSDNIEFTHPNTPRVPPLLSVGVNRGKH